MTDTVQNPNPDQKPKTSIGQIVVGTLAVLVILACVGVTVYRMGASVQPEKDSTAERPLPRPKKEKAPATKPTPRVAATPKPATAATPATAAPPALLKLKKAQIDSLSLLVAEDLGDKVDMLSQMPPEASTNYTSMDTFGPKNEFTSFPVSIVRTKSKKSTSVNLDVIAQGNIDSHLKFLGDKNAITEIRKLSVDGKDARHLIVNGQGKTGPIAFHSLIVVENPTTIWMVQAIAFEGKDPEFPAQVIESVHFTPAVNQ